MKEITIYDLLGLVKDGKAPKKIKYDKIEFIYDNGDYRENGTLNNWLFASEIIDLRNLNDKVQIIEEEKGIKKIEVTKDDNCKRYIEYDDETGHHKYAIRLIDEYYANKFNEIIDEIEMIKNENK